MGVGMIGFADAFKDLAPDMLVVLGDRFEMLAAAAAAAVQKDSHRSFAWWRDHARRDGRCVSPCR